MSRLKLKQGIQRDPWVSDWSPERLMVPLAAQEQRKGPRGEGDMPGVDPQWSEPACTVCSGLRSRLEMAMRVKGREPQSIPVDREGAVRGRKTRGGLGGK